MGMLDDMRLIQSVSKFDKEKAEDCYTNLNMNYKNIKEGLFKIKTIMKTYNLSFTAAYECAIGEF